MRHCGKPSNCVFSPDCLSWHRLSRQRAKIPMETGGDSQSPGCPFVQWSPFTTCAHLRTASMALLGEGSDPKGAAGDSLIVGTLSKLGDAFARGSLPAST